MTSRIASIGVMYPPAMREMLIMPQTGGAYDSQGRYCAPPSQLDTYAVSENVKMVSQHQHMQKQEFDALKQVLIDDFAELETRIKDAMSLMHYTIQFYPGVMKEWRTAQDAKVRIGVSDDPPK